MTEPRTHYDRFREYMEKYYPKLWAGLAKEEKITLILAVTAYMDGIF